MNRLILVGNGFDLAHGLKTSYKDFILWYLDECFKRAGIYANGEFYEDEFLHISVIEHYRLMMLRGLSGEKGLSKYLFEKGLLKSYLNFEIGRKYAAESNIEKYKHVSELIAHNISYKSTFLKTLVDTCQDCDWVDIENEYFEQLKKCKEAENLFNFDKVKQLNRELDYLKKKLREYLKEQTNQDVVVNQQLLNMMYSDFEFKDFKSIEGYESESKYRRDLGYTLDNKLPKHKLYFLNFNYTQTVNLYRQNAKSNFKCYGVNHIHGELDNEYNPIIFGFGDEHDKQYLEFEEHKNNELFEHIKSYQYFKTNNYRNLASFLNSDKYQVYIMGHSCGLSDRTMFKEIFDHENCKSVKIFHYAKNKDENDFWDKTVNLGRHFSNKGRMRKLIVDYKASDAFPQSSAEA
ncbi:AbiH family protein [Pedobacter sp. UBA4863]|uniref:AbiH family protein n=1 Tax=Pedobacter sp. UBA4863 TaxID=1947060 RepID=UPI0025FCE499|nr:AbiH family protein [Pedobacter sp. UBA4863]